MTKVGRYSTRMTIRTRHSILILVLILLIWRGGKNKQKKRRRRTYIGKSDWEKMCDDGGKFYGW